MRVKLYRENGALGSKEIFDAVEQGFIRLGHEIVDSNEDLPVIWSVLWHGRMQPNQIIHAACQKNHKPVMIIEVGSLRRGTTWRISLNNITRLGIFPQIENYDQDRDKKLGVFLKEFNAQRQPNILLLGQHDRSLQWQGLPPIKNWVEQKIQEIRQYTDRKIIVRPHPRCFIPHISQKNVEFENTLPVPNTYSEFDLRFDYHCVINHNSNTTVQAAINGAPVICDQSGLAFPVSNQLSDLENIKNIDRTEWFHKILHSEWTIDELVGGDPIKNLISLA